MEQSRPRQCSCDSVLDCHTACKLAKLKKEMHRHSGKTLEAGPKFWKSGGSSIIDTVPGWPRYITSFSGCPLDHSAVPIRHTVATGAIKAVDRKSIRAG